MITAASEKQTEEQIELSVAHSLGNLPAILRMHVQAQLEAPQSSISRVTRSLLPLCCILYTVRTNSHDAE